VQLLHHEPPPGTALHRERHILPAGEPLQPRPQRLPVVRTVDQLAAIVKNRLKRIQYRPALIDGFLAQTGLTLEPKPP